MDHLITAFDENYIKGDVLKALNNDYKECLKELNIYVKYLRSAKVSSSNQ